MTRPCVYSPPSEKSEEEWRELNRAYERRYRAAKSTGEPFCPTEDEKAARRWLAARAWRSEHGRSIRQAASRRYRTSAHGAAKLRAITKRYRESSHGRQKIRAASRRHDARQGQYLPPEHDDLDALVEQQGGTCAICKKTFDENIVPNLDHCHSSGKVRGALCGDCNRGLGMFKDSLTLLQGAMEYLK